MEKPNFRDPNFKEPDSEEPHFRVPDLGESDFENADVGNKIFKGVILRKANFLTLQHCAKQKCNLKYFSTGKLRKRVCSIVL